MKYTKIAAILAALLLLSGCTLSHHRAEIHVKDDRSSREYVYTIQRTRKPQTGEYQAVSTNDLNITISGGVLTITIKEGGNDD